MSRMTVLERDVARPICLVLFSVADKCYTLCNLANDGWLDADGLDVKVASASAEGKLSGKNLFGIGDRFAPFL